MNRKLIGSTIALILGILSFAGSISLIAQGDQTASPLAGEVMILGSLAYRSLKKRKLGIARSDLLRQIFETIAIVLILALTMFQNNFITRAYTRPVEYLIIPLWAIIAYLVIFLKKPRGVLFAKLRMPNEDTANDK